jgi:hypothetical protein
VIVGTSWKNVNNFFDDVYRADVFKREGNSWKHFQRLMPQTPDQRFGVSVSLSGTDAVIGSWLTASGERNSGVAYVFALEEGVWRQKSVLLPDENERDISFGLQTSVAGDYIVIGAPYDDHAYIYKREGSIWSRFTRLAPGDVSDATNRLSPHFGSSVAVSDKHTLVGASTDNEMGEDAGSVYAYDNYFMEDIIEEPGTGNISPYSDLGNAIRLLKVLDGLEAADVSLELDINGDRKLGLEEVLYILQVVADMRSVLEEKASFSREEIVATERNFQMRLTDFRRLQRERLEQQKADAERSSLGAGAYTIDPDFPI